MRAAARAPLVLVACAALAVAPSTAEPDRCVSPADLDRDVRAFLRNELGAHLADIRSLDPPPDRVVGALTTGEFSWGTFMRSLAAYAQLEDATTLADRDLVRTIGEIGLVEVRLGGTRFSQLYAALSLRHYGSDLASNRLWQALTPAEREAWRTLLDATRFYDPVKREAINLPENYLGVAARIAAVAWDLKLLQDRALLDSLLDRAAQQFTAGARYADDALPTGRYDRYSNEYARYVWEAALIAGRPDLLDALRPSLRDQMRLWWDLLSPGGYGYAWGRSLGVVSYLDTLEIAGFLAITPEFRPAPLDQLAAAYHSAWRWLREDYDDERHLLPLFDFGRGNFAYIRRDREWQQTVGFFGKLAHAHIQLMSGIRESRVERFPSVPALRPTARFEFFQEDGRQAGVWIVRQDAVRFMLPFTTATSPGVADYLPAPHGLPGFAAPVEQVLPALVPFLELQDGRTIVAADGADAIVPAADGRSVRASWTRWAVIGAAPAELADPGIRADVEWRLDGSTLHRVERLTASAPTTVRRWSVVVPLTGAQWTTTIVAGTRRDTFAGAEGRLTVTLVDSDWPVRVRGRATGNSAGGRGARIPIPLHLELDADDVALEAGRPRGWTVWMDLK